MLNSVNGTEVTDSIILEKDDSRPNVQHVAWSHKERAYSCSKCNLKFTFQSSLINHKKTHEIAEGSTKVCCDGCGKIFKLETTLKMHLKTCSATAIVNKTANTDLINSINTDITNTNKVSKQESILHPKKQTGNSQDSKSVSCSYETCKKLFCDKFDLMRHNVMVHVSMGPFTCDLCSNVEFLNKEELLGHIASHKDGILRPFVCLKCKKCFKLESHMIGHMRAHYSQRENKSREQELLTNPDKLMQLVKMSYRSKNITNKEKIGSVVFCKICDGFFPSQAALDNHALSHTSAFEVENESNEQVQLISLPINGCKKGGNESKNEGDDEEAGSNNEKFGSISTWRKQMPPSPPKPKLNTNTKVDNRRKRNINDVKNDFKDLCSKILEKGKETKNNVVIKTETQKQIKVEKQHDLIEKESLNKISKFEDATLQDEIKSICFRRSVKNTGKLPKAPSNTDRLSEQSQQRSLSDAAISSIVVQMSLHSLPTTDRTLTPSFGQAMNDMENNNNVLELEVENNNYVKVEEVEVDEVSKSEVSNVNQMQLDTPTTVPTPRINEEFILGLAIKIENNNTKIKNNFVEEENTPGPTLNILKPNTRASFQKLSRESTRSDIDSHSIEIPLACTLKTRIKKEKNEETLSNEFRIKTRSKK